MKLIAGLGNPGKCYADSRHNVGFAVVAELARRWQVPEARYDRHFEALLAEAQRAGQRVLLLQPQTYMNLSGRSVGAAFRYYKLAQPDLMVVLDDMDLPVGHIRLRSAGSAGGHNGMTDVIRHLGTDQLGRLRVGIGRVHRSAMVEYVLSRFEPSERTAVEQAVATAADALECWLSGGIDLAMTEFNRKPAGDPPATEPPAGKPVKGDQS
ncbi:MAG: aminoacyl-tRNA hydrolase [Planctomycetota bacterium]